MHHNTRRPIEPAHGHRARLFDVYAIADMLNLDTTVDGWKRALGHILGYDPSVVAHRFQHGANGYLTEHMADAWAIRLGRHPSEIWGDIWWDNADPELTLAAVIDKHWPPPPERFDTLWEAEFVAGVEPVAVEAPEPVVDPIAELFARLRHDVEAVAA